MTRPSTREFKVYAVFSQDELHDLRETLGWLKAGEQSFELWNNEEDAVYDTP